MSGVPQGSLLGPSLFLFYINDIPDGMTSTVRLFADDTIAYLTIKSNRDCTTLQNDLYHVTNARGVMIAVSNIPSSPTLYLFKLNYVFFGVYSTGIFK
jgi:hypothetical protein